MFLCFMKNYYICSGSIGVRAEKLCHETFLT